uniref:G-protein coupled receptors family 1 profile domain-containing protein n=1 Tax=Ditylenchus dipsaci TaxID=166011 RepID=A0A915E974_9BILA
MSNTALTASVWLMCALIFDRYRTICRPFVMRKKGSRHQQSRDRGNIHKVLCLVCVLALTFSLPRFFELSLEYDPTVEEYFLVQTSIVQNKLYMVGYRIIGGLLLYSLLPYVVLFILSFKVWLVMREAALARLKIGGTHTQPSSPPPKVTPPPSRLSFYNRQKQSISSTIHRHPQNSGQAATSDSERILVCVMAKFLLSRLMPTVLDVMEHLVGNEQFVQSPTVTTFVDTSNLLVVMASAVNFCIFYTFSRSFRHLATYWLCCGSGGKDLRQTTSQKISSSWAVTKFASGINKKRWTKLNGRGQPADHQETSCSMEEVAGNVRDQELGLDSGCHISTPTTLSCLMPTQDQPWRCSAVPLPSLDGPPKGGGAANHSQLTFSSSFPLHLPCNSLSENGATLLSTSIQCSHSQYTLTGFPQLLCYGRRISVPELKARIDQVTPETVMDLARKYYVNAPFAYTILGGARDWPHEDQIHDWLRL